MAKGKITLKDIAERANVSVSTVSRVINQNYDLLSDEIRLSVEDAMREMNYVPVSGKKTVKCREKNIKIGVLLTRGESEAMGPLLSGIISVAESYDANVMVRFHEYNTAKEQRAIESFLNGGADAIIATVLDIQHLEPIYSRLAAKRFPLVVITNERPLDSGMDISIVGNDTVNGALIGCQYLLDLGHRRILLLGAPGDRGHYAPRVAAIEERYMKNGLEFHRELVIDCPDKYVDSYAIIDRICQSGDLQFTAVFAMSDTIAFGAWDALEHNGLRVCEDVSILGYDDLRMASYKGLTTIAEPMNALGTNAANLVINMINGYQIESQHIILQDSLQIRSSCRVCRRHS